jgi:hypothetical protein
VASPTYATGEWHAYDITWRSTAQDYIWDHWYDIQTATVNATRYYGGNITTGTLTTAEIQRANYRWSQNNIAWNEVYEVQQPTWERWERMYVRERMTEEEALAQAEHLRQLQDQAQQRREEASRRRLAEAERLEGAHQRGLALLEMLMTPEERVFWETRQELMVRGSDGGMYVIEQRGVHGNVRQVDEHGCLLGRVCVAPNMYDREERLALPLSDGWVGQYLAIKHDEATFRERGNWSSLRECTRPEVPILRSA